MIPDLRRATAEDLAAVAVADGRAFGMHYSDTDLDDVRSTIEPARFLLAHDPADGPPVWHGQDRPIVGITGSWSFDVTLPGGAKLPAPGVSWVSVDVTRRRQGVLRALMAEQHRGFVADGVAISLLIASEGGIYGRFGYGIATTHRSIEIIRRRAEVRPDAADPGGVRVAGTDEVRGLAPGIHRRWAAVTPGALSRTDAWWDQVLRDREHQRHGGTALFHLVHPDGYVSYRMIHGERRCRVVEMVTATEDAHVALWRVLLDLDLVETISVRSRPLDDPLPFLLTDPRQVRTTDLPDGMWARILDAPTVLSARRYAVELDVLLDVQDPFLQLGGRYRLRGGPDGAACEATAVDGPAVGIGIAALGSLLFGGAHAVTLARAGLVEAPDPAVLRRLDAAFLADRSPQHGTEF